MINNMAIQVDDQNQYDAIIVGGSSAGLSAAMVLGRSLRTVLVIDSGRPCNRQTPHSHSFFTRDGASPSELVAIAKEQALAYPTVSLLTDKALNAFRLEDGFEVVTQKGDRFSTRKLLLATGLEDIMPLIDGFAQCWGKSVLHCPYCHGYEVSNGPIGLLGNGDMGYEFVRLLQNWSKSLTLFTNGPSTLTSEQQRNIAQLNVTVIESPIVRFEHEDGFLSAIQLEDGSLVQMTALFARVPFRQHSDLAQQLGCDLTENGLVSVAEFGKTMVPGVYAAGDNSSLMRQISMAVASGAAAAAFLNKDLIEEDLAALLKVGPTVKL
jgi:thioredoxin reductase